MLASAAPQPHPRLWLDSSTLARLTAAKDANTPEWQALKNWCDSRLGDNLSEGYQYLDWYSYVLNYGLAYRITGNTAYGNEGVIYLKALLRDRYAIGDGLGGTNAIRIDAGYVSRSMGTGVAIGRDWLDGAPNLTPAIIDECTSRTTEWMAWIHRPETYGIAEPTVNYFAGHFAMTYGAFIAFEGDPGYSSDWETKSEAMWVLARSAMNDSLAGGDWPEGWNYGHRALRHMLGYPWALQTGTDRADNHWDEIPNFTTDLVLSQVSMLHPSRALTSDDGRWTGDYKGDPRSTTCMMMSVLTETSPTAKGLARWYATHLTWEPGGPDYWEAMLYTDRSIAEIVPSPATVGGLSRETYGRGVARSDTWTNLDATFVDVSAWTDFSLEANFGEIKIASRREPLLVDGQTWQLEGQYANMPRITGTHTYAPFQEYWHATAALSMDSQDTVYTYFKLANLRGLYDGVNNDNPSAAYYQRDAVFLAPDHVIVLDNIRAQSIANTVTEQWHVMGNPALSGDTATLTTANAKLFLRTLGPAVALSKTSTDATRDGTWRIDAAPVTATVNNHIVTAFETSGTSQSAMTPIEMIHATGFIGTHIQKAGGPLIAVFSTAENAANTNAAFAFTPIEGSTRVVITGMAPSTSFDVATSAGGGGTLNVVVSPGTQHTSAANGSLTFLATQAPAGVTSWMLY